MTTRAYATAVPTVATNAAWISDMDRLDHINLLIRRSEQRLLAHLNGTQPYSSDAMAIAGINIWRKLHRMLEDELGKTWTMTPAEHNFPRTFS